MADRGSWEMAERGSWAWAGWIVFASTMLIVVGVINIFEGIIALLYNERVLVTPNNFVVVDLTSWGWTLLISGVLLLIAGIGLMSAQTWARITAIVIVGLHAVTQTAWLGAYPVWSLLMIALDTVLLFALTARWSEVRPALGQVDEMPSSGRQARETSPPSPPSRSTPVT